MGSTTLAGKGDREMEKSLIAWTYFGDETPPVYLTDFPGCDGRARNAGIKRSDYGYGKQEYALRISEYEWKKFSNYQACVGRGAFCCPAGLVAA